MAMFRLPNDKIRCDAAPFVSSLPGGLCFWRVVCHITRYVHDRIIRVPALGRPLGKRDNKAARDPHACLVRYEY
jgi:hypothetical protein